MPNGITKHKLSMVQTALKDALIKLDPRIQFHNPVMFLTEIGAFLTTLSIFFQPSHSHISFVLQIALWLWFTVYFANFAESLAEGRGKAQANALKKARTHTQAKRMNHQREIECISAVDLKKGDIVVCETGDVIPGDGEVIEGIASIDESAITGESAPVIRESGGDRSAVTGGTRVLSDRIVIRITQEPGQSFLDRMISLVEGASRAKTPNEIALSLVLSGLSLVFLLVVGSLKMFAYYSALASKEDPSTFLTVPILVSLLVCLIPTTIGGLLSAIGISGMDRLIRRNVIATSGRAIEAAGDIDVLLLDKTGTITLGNRMASYFIPRQGISERRLAQAAQLSSLVDETSEGRSIVILAKDRFDLRAQKFDPHEARFIPFSAQTRMSGVDLVMDEKSGKPTIIRKGAFDSIKKHVASLGGDCPNDVTLACESVAKGGGTPLVVSENNEILGVVALKDIVKGGIKERFLELRTMGIKTIMMTGDNSLTAASIAAESGVDDFMAEATPEDKLQRIRNEQKEGRLVAMTGDGTNDAPALAQADVGVAMNTGTQAAREAGNMVDLDSNPTKLIEIVQIGKQLLMTRGSLTTFSLANDVAKYFAILPAIFSTLYVTSNTQTGLAGGVLSRLNIMHLTSPQSAIVSAVIFNALIIIFLIPLALRGVQYKALGSSFILRKNLFIYGFGGLIVPFFGIKCIDIIITQCGLV